MEELDKISYFIDGLKAATKMEVNHQAPETFEDAWKLAIHYDTAMFGLGKSGNGKFSSSSFSSYRKFPPHDIKINHKPTTNHTTPMELDYVEGSKGKFYGKGKDLNTLPPRKKVNAITVENQGIMPRNVGAPNPRLNLQILRNHLLFTPLLTTMLNLLTWRIIGNAFSGLKERLMDTLLEYY